MLRRLRPLRLSGRTRKLILDNETAEGRLNSPKNLANKLNRIIAGNVPVKEIEKAREDSVAINPDEISVPEEPDSNPLSPKFHATHKRTYNVSMSRLSPIERTIAGVMANKGLAQKKDIAKEFRVVPETISKIAKGEVKGADNERIGAARQERIEAVQDQALNKLMSSLGLITEDKMANAKLTDLSRVAVDMSRIIDKTGPKDANNGQPVVNLTLYCPTVKSERDYKVVEVRE